MENKTDSIEEFDEEEEFEVKEYLVPKQIVNDLIDNFGILRNELSEVLDIPSSHSKDNARNWWQEQGGDDQIILRAALTAIAAPSLISQISIMRGNEHQIGTTLAQESMRPDDPCFLIGEDTSGNNLRIRRIRSPDVMSATIMLYLDANMEIGVADFNFTTELDDFHTLLGVLDLYRRRYYQVLMEHEPLPRDFKTENILKSIEDAHQYGDPRWLLPFALPVLPNIQVPDKDTLSHSLYNLAEMGIISITEDYTDVSLTEPSELLGTDLRERPSSIRITNLGYNSDGTPASLISLFLRGENLIWYVNIGGEDGTTASWAAIEMDTVSELLNEVFTPVGAPPMVTKDSLETPPCSKCGNPTTWIEDYQRWYCYNCQQYLETRAPER